MMTQENASQGGQSQQDSGNPGGGVGRVETPGRSGVYPVSNMGQAPGDATFQGEESFGQGKRGQAGYQDHGGSELSGLGEQQSGPQRPSGS